MTAEYLVEILHGVGFLTGAALYAMLVAMVVQSAGRDVERLRRDDGLAMVTGLLGLAWNLGALALVTHPRAHAGLFAVAYAALGVLPAVFVHAAVRSWKGDDRVRRASRWITGFAYTLSGGAALVQVGEAALGQATPSRAAFQALAAGFLVLVAVMVAASPAEARRSGGLLWMAALALFAVSAWHLGQHQGGEEGWPAVVLGHHASVPLALAILWSDYRFALADIFLKRALAVMALVAVVASLYLGLFGAHLTPHTSPVPAAPEWVLAALALSTAIALSYPLMRRTSGWLVDSVLLRRPDAAGLRAEVARRLVACETPEDILKLVADSLAPALSARSVSWKATAEALPPDRELVLLPDRSLGSGVSLSIPTTEPPHYALAFESLEGGRRVLSDDVALLEGVALAAARRLDALRWLHERCERDLREELVAKLATEAELRALQAQLNPHFLFNALNTLGYLMKAAPERARSTLLDLTKLLRAVLKRSGGELATLGDEVDLVLTSLAI
jgi:Histidine kinase